MADRRLIRKPSPEAHLTAPMRRRARREMTARDEIRRILENFTDENICDRWRIVEALAQPDGYGRGTAERNRSGIPDPVGALVAIHAGPGGDAADTWAAHIEPLLVSALFVGDQVVASRSKLRSALRQQDKLFHRPQEHDDTRGATISTCRSCRQVVSGALGDRSHAGLCETCHRLYLSLRTPRPSIGDWLMSGGTCELCASPISGTGKDHKTLGMCGDCHTEYLSIPEPRPPASAYLQRGGRCDCCDRLCSGGELDRLIRAGGTGERYCPRCHRRFLRHGGIEVLAEVREAAG